MILYRLITAKEAELYKRGEVPPIKESRYEDSTGNLHEYENKEFKSGECLYFFGSLDHVIMWYEVLKHKLKRYREVPEEEAKYFFEKLEQSNDVNIAKEKTKKEYMHGQTQEYYTKVLGGKLKNNELEKEHYEEIISQMQKRKKEEEIQGKKRKDMIQSCVESGILNLPGYGILNMDVKKLSRKKRHEVAESLLGYAEQYGIKEDYSIIKIDIPIDAQKLIDYGCGYGYYNEFENKTPEYRIRKEDFKLEWIKEVQPIITIGKTEKGQEIVDKLIYKLPNYARQLMEQKRYIDMTMTLKLGVDVGKNKANIYCDEVVDYAFRDSLYKDGEEYIRLLNGKKLNYSNIGEQLQWMKSNKDIEDILEIVNSKLNDIDGEEIIFGPDNINHFVTKSRKSKQTLKEKNEIYYSDLVPANLLNRIYNKYGREILEKTITQDMDVEQMVATINLLATGNIDFPHWNGDEQTKKTRYFNDKEALEFVMQGLDSEKIKEIELKQEEIEKMLELKNKSKEFNISLLRELREEKYNLTQEGNDLAKQLEEFEKGQDLEER